MDQRAERAREMILNGFDEITRKDTLTPESLCNLEKLIKGLHYFAEIDAMENIDPAEYEPYERGYGERGRVYRRSYRRNYNRDGYEDADMKMFLEDSLRNARSEQERERIHRLMSKM